MKDDRIDEITEAISNHLQMIADFESYQTAEGWKIMTSFYHSIGGKNVESNVLACADDKDNVNLTSREITPDWGEHVVEELMDKGIIEYKPQYKKHGN